MLLYSGNGMFLFIARACQQTVIRHENSCRCTTCTK